MTVVVILALLGGTVASTGFGIAAWRQAALAQKNEADAVAKGKELATANDKLTRNADQLETTLARSLLRPLGLQGGDKPMTEPEWEALWELATNHRGRLGYRFVEEASRTPGTSRQLRDRAALALSAAVGLDAEWRAEVETLLLARLDDTALGDEQKTDLALAASAWDDLSSAAAGRTAQQLTHAMVDAREPNALRQLAEGLSAVAARMAAEDAAVVTGQTATNLVKAMRSTTDSKALQQLAEGLSAVTARMAAKDAVTFTGQAATTLVKAMKDNKDTKDTNVLVSLSLSLSELAPSLEAGDAAHAVTALVQLIPDTHNPYGSTWQARALSAVARRLEPRDAAQAADTLVQSMKTARNGLTLSSLAQGLSAVATRMEPRDAAQAATTLVQAMKDTKQPNVLDSLAAALSAVVARMEAKDAASTATQAATALASVMKHTKYPDALQQLALGLSAVAPRLEAKDAAQATTTLARAMKDTKNPSGAFPRTRIALPYLVQGLSTVATRLETSDAAQTATTLVQITKNTKEPYALSLLAKSLSAVTVRMEPKYAATIIAQAAIALVQVMVDTQEQKASGLLPRDLSALLSAVPSSELSSRTATAASAGVFPPGAGHPLTALALLFPVAEPPPCLLSTQQLVELLKMPTCTGAARRVILDQLGNRYRRTFGDVWEFVRFTREQNLGLDFTTPPQRPEPAAAR
jgi:hypothetical protein